MEVQNQCFSPITNNINPINNIIENGIDPGADIVYGSRYSNSDNNTSGFIDEPTDNVDALFVKLYVVSVLVH